MIQIIPKDLYRAIASGEIELPKNSTDTDVLEVFLASAGVNKDIWVVESYKIGRTNWDVRNKQMGLEGRSFASWYKDNYSGRQ
jgi:hypothetical protein